MASVALPDVPLYVRRVFASYSLGTSHISVEHADRATSFIAEESGP